MSSDLYQRLDSNSHEIRILEFAWNEQRALFRGRVRNESLIDIKSYTALSYRWGDPASDKLLRLYFEYTPRPRMVPITDSLHSALWALWKRKGDEKLLRRLWIDAICINQDDLYERSQQVQMMRQIYSRAEEVIAWVGPTDGSSLSSTEPNYLLDTRLASEEAWQARKTFFNEEYWKRVWIIQEITVASNVTMLYGDHEFSWNSLVVVLTSLLEHLTQGRTDHESEVGEIAASHILKFREHWMDSNKPITLFQAMTWSLHTKATDPRDKIFALLGLCHDGFRLVPIPNYRQSLVSIISEMSRLTFSHSRSLDLMCLRGTGGNPKEYSGMPSWVPNWPFLWSSGSITAHEKMIFRSPTPVDYDLVLRDSTNSVLKVEAILLGRINAVSSGLKTCAQEKRSQHASKSWIFSLEESHRTAFAPNESNAGKALSRKWIWRTLTMNTSSLDVDVESKEFDECFAYLWTPQGRGSIYSTEIIDWLDENASFRLHGLTLREWSQLEQQQLLTQSSGAMPNFSGPWPNSGATENPRIKAWEAVNQSLEKVLGSAMRLAEWWSYSPDLAQFPGGVALVNPRTRMGDHIFGIRGCSVLVVMRLVEPVHLNRWEVIGALWFPGHVWGAFADVKLWLEGNTDDPPLGMGVSTWNLV